MKNSIAFILVLMSLAQIGKAQYTRAVKGDRVQYDSAVITHLPQWRKESLKFKASQTYIDSLKVHVDSLMKQIEVRGMIKLNQDTIIARQERSAQRNEKSFTDLNSRFDALLEVTQKKRRVWDVLKDDWEYILVSLLAGYLIAK
jgi:hypothetical protein